MKTRSRHDIIIDALYLLGGLLAVLAVCLWVASKTNADLLAHSAFDSYAKQAMAWRDGRIALDQNYPWLELAIYQGNYYVSFPPIPAVPMWILSFFVGENTPSGLMTLLYFLGAYVVMYLLIRRYLPAPQAVVCAIFVALGGSALDLAVSGDGFSGGVWFQAQMLAMLFTALAFYLVDGRKRASWAVGLICIALAVGCRPFNALYVPVLLWMLYQNVEERSFWRTIVNMLPFIVVPALIACAYGAYNFVRFGNPLEFGHAYLPELAQAGEPMFVPGRLWYNIQTIFRPMSLTQGQLTFPTVSGFAVYLTNPLIFLAALRAIVRAIRKDGDSIDAVLGVLLLAHGLLLLTHRTNGGWQYGTRYLVDLLPGLVFLYARGRQKLLRGESLIMGILIALNTYGTIVFHYL